MFCDRELALEYGKWLPSGTEAAFSIRSAFQQAATSNKEK